jgi:hypothetical protein
MKPGNIYRRQFVQFSVRFSHFFRWILVIFGEWRFRTISTQYFRNTVIVIYFFINVLIFLRYKYKNKFRLRSKRRTHSILFIP